MYTVYTITENGVVKYVGKTKNYSNRKREHLNCRGTHYSAIPTDIDLSTIEIHPIALYTDKVQALKFEDWMIHKHNTIDNGWNKNRSGYIWTDDVNAYMNTYMKAYQHTTEWKTYRKAYEQTPERKAYMKEYRRKYRLRKKQNIETNE